MLAVDLKFGSVVQKVVLSVLTKPRQDSALENGTDDDPVLFQYFKVATSVQDFILLPRRKWHEQCWRLPSDSL